MLIILFDIKGDALKCKALRKKGLDILSLSWKELQICIAQPPRGMETDLASWLSSLTFVIATNFDLFMSTTVIMDTWAELFKESRPAGTFPTLTEWITKVEKYKGGWRITNYRDTTLMIAKFLAWSFRETLDYAQSDMLHKMLTDKEGLVRINCMGLSPVMAGFLACLFINYAFEYRRRFGGQDCVLFVLDDAQPLLMGSHRTVTEGNLNPVTQWITLSRYLNMGMVFGVQNLSVISPLVTGNVTNLAVFQSFADDKRAAAQILSLSEEQAERIDKLKKGSAIFALRELHEYPVLGFVPNLDEENE